MFTNLTMVQKYVIFYYPDNLQSVPGKYEIESDECF